MYNRGRGERMMKCVVSDLDGTLLNRGLLSEKNKKALKMLQERGIDFIIATGRDLSQTKSLFDELGFVCDSILLNGACYMNKNYDIEFTIGIDKEAIIKASEIIFSMGLGLMFYTKDKVLSYKTRDLVCEDFYNALMEYSSNIVGKEFYDAIVEVNDLDELMEHVPLNGEVMSVRGDVVEECRKKLKEIDSLSVTSSIPKEIEFTSTKANKGNAVLEVCRRKGFKPDEVVLFGDGGNDLSMFKMFERAYAMGNADPVIQKAAKYHCPSVEEDGFYYQILELLGESDA